MSPRDNQMTVYDDSMLDDECEQSVSPIHENKKSVSFGSIEIREYTRIVGDHPDVKIGVPISIGWAFYQREAIPLDVYEANRHPKRVILRLSSIARKNMLRNIFDIPEKEITSAEKEIQKIQKQRERSIKQSKVGAQVEDVIKSKSRGLLRGFFVKDIMYRGLVASTQAMQMPMYAGM